MGRKEDKEVGHVALMADRLNAYKWIKFAQCLILIVMGLIFICLCKAENLIGIISIGFWVVLLVYAVLEIFSAIMIKKSILSSEIFVSLIIMSLSLMVVCNKNLQEYYILTWFFGILIAGYALILIASGVISLTFEANDEKYGTKKWQRTTLSVLKFTGAAALVALDICLWIFGPKTEEATNGQTIMLVPILIGASLIMMGLASMFYAFQASTTESILKKQVEQTKAPIPSEEEDLARAKNKNKKDLVKVNKESEDDVIIVDVSNTEPKKEALEDSSSTKFIEGKKD